MIGDEGSGAETGLAVEASQLFHVRNESAFYSAGVAESAGLVVYIIADWRNASLVQVTYAGNKADMRTYSCGRTD